MYQADFSREELAERRQRVLEAIGPGALALVQGGAKQPGHDLFRQTNDMFYLTGVEVPQAYLLLDGRSSSCALFLPHQSATSVENEGELLSSDNAATVCALTGIEVVRGPEELGRHLQGAKTLYTPLRRGEGATMSWDTLQQAQQAAWADPWDGQPDRMQALVATLRQRLPGTTLHDLSPITDALRMIKSPREIALLRRAGHLSAIGVLEAMRTTRPGVWEYQIDAVMRYTYLVNGARDAAYRAIIASGANTQYGHYNANNACLQDGDLVLVDCAPDFHYYTSDIGRMWPVNGRYTDVQRALYGFVVAYHQVFLELIRPGVTAEQITTEAAARMRAMVDALPSVHPLLAAGARWAFEFPYHMSHPVGMAVHDVSHYRGQELRPGMVISLDPTLRVPEEHLYYRVEDTLLITEEGNENLTAAAPLELEEVEAVMRQEGMVQRYPALW